MVRVVIPCWHEAEGVDTEIGVPDYYPLTKAEIKELLDMAASSSRTVNLSQIQGRLNQGIRGMSCPRTSDPDDRVYSNSVAMDQLFLDRCHEGGTPEMVDLFDKLLNWE